MNGDAGYALQKLELSIIELATGPGDIRSRLSAIYINHFTAVPLTPSPSGRGLG